MRAGLGLLLALLVVLAGCSVPFNEGTPTTPAEPTTTGPAETTPTATPAETPTTPTETPTETDGTDTNDTTSEMVDRRPNPPSDRLGWEAGVWYNERIDVDNSDGMNATERRLAVARAMARVEHVRQLEFPGNDTIPIDVISRAEFRERGFGPASYSESYRTFDNVKFEALLFVGEDQDSLAVQESNQGSSVLGYYSPSNDSIVLISEGELPTFDGEETLAQEVAHALQDQVFNLTAMQRTVRTRDAYTGQNGVIEGDGNRIDELYVRECEQRWACIPSPNGSSGQDLPDDFNWGLYFMQFVPYSDGPGFIEHYYDRGGWDRIDAMYEDPPESSEQVIIPEKYETDPPVNVSLSDRTGDGWQRVRPESQRPGVSQPAYDTLGMGSLSAMFMRTNYVDRGPALVSPFEFLNFDAGGNVNSSDPINYNFSFTNGWEGDRLHVYEQAETGETGYVWRLVWESPGDAEEFATEYERLLGFWGANQTTGDTWLADGGPFADAFDVRVDGDTVTIVNAPTTDSLTDVRAEGG